jgi:hypothetical protein
LNAPSLWLDAEGIACGDCDWTFRRPTSLEDDQASTFLRQFIVAHFEKNHRPFVDVRIGSRALYQDDLSELKTENGRTYFTIAASN